MRARKTEQPYAIIGAGPSGLAAARAFVSRGIPFIGFESHSDVGGMWDLKNQNSVIYQSAHLISSKEKSQFAEFPMPEEWPDFLPHRLVKQYLNDYADRFDLKKHFRFNSRVIESQKLKTGGWELVTEQGAILVEGIVMATGPYQTPRMPELRGTFGGEVLHSKRYKDPSIFSGKKVLVVGLGNTACDIAVDAIPFAERVDISVRDSNYFVPKTLLGKPTDQMVSEVLPRRISRWANSLVLRFAFGTVESYGLPAPKFKFLDKHPILNSLLLHHLRHGDVKVRPQMEQVDGSKVLFKDGTSETYDLILMATGYAPKFPYMRDEHLNLKQGIPDFHLKIFHPSLNDLFIIGMLESTGIGWQGRLEQAELVADFIHCLNGKREKPLQTFQKNRQKRLVLTRTRDDDSLFIDKKLYSRHMTKTKKLLT